MNSLKSLLEIFLIIFISTFIINLIGCSAQPFPKKYWADYLENIEVLNDTTEVVNKSYISSLARYHPFFPIADSKNEAEINYTGKLFLSDSILYFIPTEKQVQSWPEIKPFKIKISTVSKSTIGSDSQPISIFLETSNISYLFFSNLSNEQLKKYKSILK